MKKLRFKKGIYTIHVPLLIRIPKEMQEIAREQIGNSKNKLGVRKNTEWRLDLSFDENGLAQMPEVRIIKIK